MNARVLLLLVAACGTDVYDGGVVPTYRPDGEAPFGGVHRVPNKIGLPLGDAGMGVDATPPDGRPAVGEDARPMVGVDVLPPVPDTMNPPKLDATVPQLEVCDTHTTAVGFARDWLRPRCGECHDYLVERALFPLRTFPHFRSDNDQGLGQELILGRVTSGCQGDRYINKFEPNSSYIVKKVRTPQCAGDPSGTGAGERCPKNAAPISPDEWNCLLSFVRYLAKTYTGPPI